ncbi:MAG: hypothetical protein JWN62_2176 [Acidimicrobiales bacterium]|nr:hypothetical protein [Acidimicrobiales bacterium]
MTLPADYAVGHVRLGYAATEMDTQSDTDTVTASVELASNATTCHNLYVAMTRGRRDNTVYVITDTATSPTPTPIGRLTHNRVRTRPQHTGHNR